MHGKLETDHKTHAFIFHTSHHKSPKKKNLQNLSIIKPITIQPKKKFGERTQRGGRWLGKPRKFHSHGLTVSSDRSEREECWLGVDGGVDMETHGGGVAE